MSEALIIFLINFVFIYTIQSLSSMLGIYALIGQKIELKSYFIGSAILLVSGVLIRMLPIQKGVHTLMILVVITLIAAFYLKFSVYLAVMASLSSVMVLLLIETLSLFIYKLVMSDEVYVRIISGDSISNALSGIPVNILFFVAVLTLYIYTTSHGKKPLQSMELAIKASKKSGDDKKR